ncbi:hypothetical protein D3C72_1578640 [compost metagenome]
MGWVRSSAWICVFSSTESTSALSGGFRYSPTTSTTLSAKCGSLLILKVFSRWGLRSAAAHTWATCQTVTPAYLAISRRLQWVASRGTRWVVRLRISLIFASSSLRGCPLRGRSFSPSRPAS